MSHLHDNLSAPDAPASHVPSHAVHSLPLLAVALDAVSRQPIVNLRDAFLSLGVLEAPVIDALVAECPDLLRSRSHELVDRFLMTDEDLQRALARVAGVVEIDLDAFQVDVDAFAVLPLRQARAQQVMPLGMAHEQFFVASWKPTSTELHQQLCAQTGHSVTLVWAARTSIERRLNLQELPSPPTAGAARQPADGLAWVPPATAHLVPHLPHAGPAATAVEDLVVQAMAEVGTGAEAEQLASASESAGMVRLVNQMIGEALRSHVSDIHIETNPGEALTSIRFRRDGDLEPYIWVPARLRGPLVSRLKIMAKLDIAERRRPQDGKIDFAEFGGPALELRVAVMPTHDGLEDVVLRLLEAVKPLPLSRLGLQPRDEVLISGFSQRSYGLVLAAGPTGSGKTTTLHSMLAEVNTPERKIWTAEDPIEITQPGLRQVQMNAKIGLTFASAMRGFLRADPDIIMIGEVRDAETAHIAIEASLTGHLVLSTLHTNNACESVVRLLDLGMDPMNFADSLLGIVAQRLVRALCPACAESRPLSAGDWDALVQEYADGSPLSAAQAQERLLIAAGVETPDAIHTRHACGCEHCSGRGYKGRLGVYEILQNSRVVKQLIQARARPAELFDAAVAEGMRSLRHDALEKLVQGRLDLKQARAAYR